MTVDDPLTTVDYVFVSVFVFMITVILVGVFIYIIHGCCCKRSDVDQSKEMSESDSSDLQDGLEPA
jgi:uncharacterized membrane protein